MENILHKLRQHLIEKDLLRKRPAEQMYKISVIKFILCVGKYSNFLQTMYNEQSEAFNIYSQLLIVPEAEIQIIAWGTIFEVLKKESFQQRKILSIYAIDAVADFTKDLHKYNPKLQDAIFDFLYNCLMDVNEYCIADKRKICNLVTRKIHSHDASNIYSQRICYLRLLGKCMVTLTHELKVCRLFHLFLLFLNLFSHRLSHICICLLYFFDIFVTYLYIYFKNEEFRMEDVEDIYRKVCDSSWIGSLGKDLRSSVFDILYDLFNKDNIDFKYCRKFELIIITIKLT